MTDSKAKINVDTSYKCVTLIMLAYRKGTVNIMAFNGQEQFVSVRLPKDLKDKFDRRYPSRGEKSKVVRGLIQMLLDGKITKVSYTESI